MLWVAIVTNVVALAAIPAWAILSDRIGRKPVFIFGAVGSGALMFAYLAAIESGRYPLIFLSAVLMSGVVYSAMNGIQPSLYGEMFPTRVRLSGMAIGTQIGFAIGGFAPTAAAAIAGDGPRGWVPVAAYVLVSSLIAAIAVATARETAKLPLRAIDGRTERFVRRDGRDAGADRGGRAVAGAAYDAVVAETTTSGRVRDADRTQREILDVATREFADQGFAGARVDEIAAQTRTTKRMIYYYFGSKEALFVAVLERAYATIRSAEQTIEVDHLEPAAAIRRLAELTFDHHESHPDFIRLVSIENIHRAEHIAGHAELAGQNTPAIELIERILERGRADGSFTRDVDAVDLHMMISAFCVFRVANRHTFGAIFDRDLLDAALRDRYRRMLGDMVVEYLGG